MITKISGVLKSLGQDSLTLALGELEYEVRIPEFTRRQLQDKQGQKVSLYTIHYLEGNQMQGRLVPRLVGFLNEVEREFFEMFCSVDGVGAKKALRAMVRPVQDVAAMIEEQDAKNLASLPGIGPATADRIVAKLRRKVPKFALLVARETPRQADVERDVVSQTFEVLRKLGHSEADARRLLDAALEKKGSYTDVEALLHAVYKQRNE
ncbi:MAG: Holliday junction branch migration protein RuvA [Pirellulales bacterium]